MQNRRMLLSCTIFSSIFQIFDWGARKTKTGILKTYILHEMDPGFLGMGRNGGVGLKLKECLPCGFVFADIQK